MNWSVAAIICSAIALLWYFIDRMELKVAGVLRLYQRYKHDPSDRILCHRTTMRGEMSVLLHWRLLRIGIGERCLHLSFFALPVLFKPSLAIPWEQVELIGTLESSLLPIFRSAEFRIGPDHFFLRLRGNAARAVQGRFLDLARST